LNDSIVTQTDILAALRDLGVTPGVGLMIHSSLKSFGYVEGGAAAVVAALMEAVTPAGTLLLPTFNHGAPFEPGGPGYFHPQETPTTNGAIPDAFWRLSGVTRSLDPTHPFAAWGKHARRYTEFHHRTLTMGPDSPLGLLHADNGWCLLMGVDYEFNTFQHVVETTLGVPCLGLRSEAYPVVLPDGRRVLGRTWGWRERYCPLTDENRYHDRMEARGLQKERQIGQSRFILFRLRDCFEVVAEVLREGKDGFPPCTRCPIRPRLVPETVASDWDAENQRLLPDSEAWNY
jgi:aminoglycoside N3'-acetyltransferase